MVTDIFKRPLQALRISVIDACNFRCNYCMPENEYPRNYKFLKKKERLDFSEILRLTRLFVELGVDKVRLTGGEPLLCRDLSELVKELAQIPQIVDLSLTTNGWFLAEQAKALKEAGLNRLTISLDSLNPELFRKISGGKGALEKILEGIQIAKEVGFAPLKINVVVQRGVNDSELLHLVEYFRRPEYIVRFIEYMDVGTLNGWRLDQVVPSQEIITLIEKKYPLEPIGGNYGEVAKRYRYLDGQGEVGFISSVSQPFCGSCNRARLSAEGKFYTCLFASQGLDLQKLLREGASDAEILQSVRQCWQSREDRYSEERTCQTSDPTKQKVEMYHIGG